MKSIVIASTVAIAILTGGGAYAANALAPVGADMCSSSVQDAVAYSVETSRC